MSSVTPLRPVVTPDRTNALRQKRFRQRRKQAAVTQIERNGTPISTIEMCALGSRLKSGTVTLDDLRMADRLIMALVCLLPRDSTIQLPD
jgi:hypothetical protein